MQQYISKIFHNDKTTVPVVFATDKNFVPYLYVAIQSLVDNSSKDNNYDIVILCSDVCEYQQNLFKQLQAHNISIRFYNMDELMNKYKGQWYTHWKYSDSVYYRFFIPQIFSEYEKVVFLDADIVVNCDVYELYSTDMNDNVIGAVVGLARQISDDWHRDFITNVLKIRCDKYFNAGVLIFDLSNIDKNNFVDKCVKVLADLNNPPMQDQDVFNFIFKNKVQYIDIAYNLTWNCIHYWHNFGNLISENLSNQYASACETPKIIHYAGKYKPWKQPHLAYSEYFWKYARKTPFYEQIIYQNRPISNINRDVIYNAVRHNAIYLQYLRCKLLKLISWGKKKEHYKKKAKNLKTSIRDYRKTLRKK